MKIDLLANVGGASGYDEHARAFTKALMPHCDLNLPIFGQGHAVNSLTDEEMVMFSKLHKPNRIPDVMLHFQVPTLWQPHPNSKNIGVFPWETSRIPCRPIVTNGIAPPPAFNWVEQCNKMDEIWTFSKAAVAAIVNTGVKKPVHLIPGPFDFDKWSSNPTKQVPITNITNETNGYPITNKKFIIGCMGEWTLRKDIESFLKCCFIGLPAGRCTILLKSNAPNYKPDYVISQINNLKSGLKLPVVPQVVLIDDIVSNDTLKSIISYMDVYASTSKGEGFDIPLMMAMSQKKICVAGLHSSRIDYLDKSNSIAVNCTPEFISYPDDGLNNCCLNYSGDQMWYKPNEVEFILNIQKVYQDWEKDNKLSNYDTMRSNAQNKIKQSYNIENCGKVCSNILKRLCGLS